MGVTRLLSDDRLARRAAAGDERAFATIFSRYHQDLYRYCLAIVGSPEDAQDALQNTMVKALRALPGEERQIRLKPWLYRVAHNESVDLLRRRRETRELDATVAAPGLGLAEEAVVRERLRGLMADLDELSELQRGAVVMRELSGLGLAEIGTALGTSTAVAGQTLFEARRSLRQMAEGREMDCEEVSRVLSSGDGRLTKRRDVRAHLRACASCRGFGEEIARRERDFAALAGLPAVAAAKILQGLIGGGGGGAGGGGLATALGGGAANSAGAAAVLKGAVLAGVVGAIGVGAADRGGFVDLGWSPQGGDSATIPAQRAAWSIGPAQARPHPSEVAASARVDAQAPLADTGVEDGGRLGAANAASAPAPATPPAGGAAGVRAESPTAQGGGKADPATEGTGGSPAGEDPAPQGSTPPSSSGEESSPGQGKGQERNQGKGAGAPPQSSNPPENAGKGGGGDPSKPRHPEHPSTPSSENGPPSSPPGQAVREEHSQAPAVPPGQVTAGAPPGQESSPGQGKGKKP
ncbi:MAG TPA: sigma-70 family RNA polymerase sigma factor [Solirubrobacterales bacterium]|nr:sigma-70 family RNA polymerase sigma factor [Solirubrobacterales bacterium]